MMSSLLNNRLLLVRGKLLQGAINIIKDIWVDASSATEWNIWQPFPQHSSSSGTGKPGASKHYRLFSILYSRQHLNSAHIIRRTFIQSHKLSSVHRYQRERESRTVMQHLPGTDSGESATQPMKMSCREKKYVIRLSLSHKPSSIQCCEPNPARPLPPSIEIIC